MIFTRIFVFLLLVLVGCSDIYDSPPEEIITTQEIISSDAGEALQEYISPSVSQLELSELELSVVPTLNDVAVVLKPYSSGTHWVSFGLPLHPGAINNILHLRVVDDLGQEIPVFTRSLGRWRNIPPSELLCDGLNPTFRGIRSVLIQFPYTFSSTDDVNITVQVGTSGQRLESGIGVRKTYRVVNDARLYFGDEVPRVREPKVFAAIDHSWLSCAGLNTMAGLTDQHSELSQIDTAQKNFFYTSIADYRSSWDAPSGSWVVSDTYQGVDLYAADDGTWLYQRPQTFYNAYMRTGIFDMLREAEHAAFHYTTLIYTPEDCAGSTWPDWCIGFFEIKNPNPNTSWKDYKYSYGEDVATYYWLTGDPQVKKLMGYISSATNKIEAHETLITERFTAVAIAGPVFEYEVTGNIEALNYATTIVDFLYAQQNSRPTGCITGNGEWGDDGFSPWMAPLMTQALLRYYFTSGDARVPEMLAKSAKCLVDWGMEWTDAIQDTNMLIPFYGATDVGTPHDLDGSNPWAGIEHSLDVAQGVALGLYFETNPIQKQALVDATIALLRSSEWAINYWTRTTAGLPKYRVSPWRKYNWWFKNTGALQWAMFGKPTL